MLSFAPPPPPVSYSREIAPILAMHCNGCHGDAGGLSTRTHAELMAGGNMGPVIVAGDSERSLLVHFIDGRRGEAHRMPLGGRPLSPRQIAAIRRWIDEGARPDTADLPRTVRTLEVRLPARLVCRVSPGAYVVLTIRDRRTGRALLERAGAVKSPKEPGDLAEPGEAAAWEIKPEPGWPKDVSAELVIQYAESTPEVQFEAS